MPSVCCGNGAIVQTHDHRDLQVLRMPVCVKNCWCVTILWGSRSLYGKWYLVLTSERLRCCSAMANAVTSERSAEDDTWVCHRHDMPSHLPKGLQHLVLPPLFLPDEIVKEINKLAELTCLECSTFNGHWPSQDLIGLKVRSMCWCILQVQLASRCF